jgi:hypothetical protein
MFVVESKCVSCEVRTGFLYIRKYGHTTDPSSRQRGRPISTNQELCDSNKGLVLDARWGLTVGHNIYLTFTN